jgi:hypothetical protein
MYDGVALALAFLICLACCSSSSSAPQVTCPSLKTGSNGGAPASELPTGACSGAGSCDYLVAPCGTNVGDEVDGDTCTCSGGQWSCQRTAQGLGVCTADAGPIEDASGD